MSDEKYAKYTRFPFIVLPYTMKQMAIPKELMMDYDNGVMYVRSIDGLTDIPIGAMSSEHLDDFKNPHKVNKEQVGLGKVENYPVATLKEALEGIRDDRYITPYLLRKILENYKVADPIYGLTVDVDPIDAVVEVYYNGDWNIGNIHNLPDGRYQYKVSKEGYREVSDEIIISGKSEYIFIKLNGLTNKLTFETDPVDAIVEVKVDGQWIEGKEHNLPDGEYDYRVYVDEWIDEEVDQTRKKVKFLINEYDLPIDRIEIISSNNNKIYINGDDDWSVILNRGEIYSYNIQRLDNKYGIYYNSEYGPSFNLDDIDNTILVKRYNIIVNIPKTFMYDSINIFLSYDTNNYSDTININDELYKVEYKTLYMNTVKYLVRYNYKIIKEDDIKILNDLEINIGEPIYNLTISPTISDCDIKIGKVRNIYGVEKWIPIDQDVPINVETNNSYRYIVYKEGYRINCGIINNIDKDTNINVSLNKLDTFKDISLYVNNIGMGIKESGELVYWSNNGVNNPIKPPAGNYKKVVIGGSSKEIYLALTSDGTIIGGGETGSENYKILTNIPSGNGYKDIAISGWLYNNGLIGIAIKSDGSLIMWGDNNHHSHNDLFSYMPTGNNFESIYLTNFGIGLTTEGKVIGWGAKDQGFKAKSLEYLPSDSGYKKVYLDRTGKICLLSSIGKIIVIGDDGLIGNNVPNETGYKDMVYYNDTLIALNSNYKIELFSGTSYRDFDNEFLEYSYSKIISDITGDLIIGIRKDTNTLFLSNPHGTNLGNAKLDKEIDKDTFLKFSY